jgi:hypothetical protein
MEWLHGKHADFTATDRADHGLLFVATAAPSVRTFVCLKLIGVSTASCGPAIISAGHSDIVLDLLNQNVIAIDNKSADGCSLLCKGDHAVVSHLLGPVHEAGDSGSD